MTSPITSQTTNKSGLCPHGLPYSMCPICSKMGSGMMKKKDKPAPVKSNGEWSYMKCYVEGLRLRNLKNIKEGRLKSIQNQLNLIQKMSFKVSEFINNINSKINNLPVIIKGSVSIILNVIVKPIVFVFNLVVDIGKNIFKFVSSALEKLSTLIGEFKNFIKRKKEDKLKEKLKDKFLDFIQNIVTKKTLECDNDKSE